MAAAIKIEKAVPVPVKHRASWPFGKMEVGDSVFVADPAGTGAAHSAYAFAKYNKQKFTARREGGGMRIWRIE